MISFTQRKTASWICLLLLICAVLIASHVARPFVYLSHDIDTYEKISVRAWIDPVIRSEYPPLTTSLFALLNPPSLSWVFPDMWILMIVIVLLAAAAWCAVRCSVKDACKLLGASLLTMLLLGFELTWGRYDVLIGLLLLLTWLAHKHERFAAAGFFLLLAASFKLVPLVLLPILLLKTEPTSRRSLLRGGVVGILLGLIVPLLTLGMQGSVGNMMYMLQYHAARGVQVESTWSGLSMLSQAFQGKRSTIIYEFASYQNIEVWKIVRPLSVILALLGLGWVFLRSRTRKSPDPAPLFLCALFWLLSVSTVLSPQYLCWVLPLLFAWFVEQVATSDARKRNVSIVIASLSIVAALMTYWLYFGPEQGVLLAQKFTAPTIVLNVRNALLLLLAWLLYAESVRKSSSTSSG